MFKGNKIFITNKNGNKKRVFWFWGLKIRFKGKNSIINLQEPLIKFKRSKLVLGNNCKINIGSSKYKADNFKIISSGDNINIDIGKNFSCTNGFTILAHKENNLNIKIGDDCMAGTNVVLRCSDAHSIIDLETKKVVNKATHIDIGNHVWLAMNTTILKNTRIAENCVVATGSIVTKDCKERNSIYGGIAAKLLKRNITWDRISPELGDNL